MLSCRSISLNFTTSKMDKEDAKGAVATVNSMLAGKFSNLSAVKITEHSHILEETEFEILEEVEENVRVRPSAEAVAEFLFHQPADSDSTQPMRQVSLFSHRRPSVDYCSDVLEALRERFTQLQEPHSFGFSCICQPQIWNNNASESRTCPNLIAEFSNPLTSQQMRVFSDNHSNFIVLA
ncbi:hypothetical protein DdX_18335 [Ditylenchus destructor]|uniref:Uncharacterized protein n=1 Tax=Ditylenchus destructor TaxID=166010 RepID=A0AAD4ML00_9BILA|nr:hypothetical protein DdX_18335 [Ditylenchus destructor]